MVTENYIWELLQGEHDYRQVIYRLESLGRKKAPGLEEHHLEPERVRVVYLKPLEHLAIHVAHAKLDDTNSNRAKVCAFVRYFPGGFRRLVNVSPDLQEALISFGQGRPESGVNLNQHPNTIAATKRPRTKKQLKARAETGRRTILTNSWHAQGMTNTWGTKVAETVRNKPMCCCLLCGREMKAITSNIIQHQRSNKCLNSSLTKQKNSTED